MPTLCLKRIACLCVPAALLACSTARADDQARIRRARQILKLWSDGRYKQFVATGTEQVRAAFSPQQAEQARAAIAFQLGKYQSVRSAKLVRLGGYDSVDLVCRFERGTCTLRVTLDRQGRMAGFHCMALHPDPPYEPPQYVRRRAFHEEKVSVSAGQFPLAGTLALPNAPGAHPALVLVHGSGPHDQDETVAANKPFRDLAWGLASRGIATLRYVKRTKAYPTARRPGEWTLEDETIDDALAAVRLLRQRPDLESQRIFVLGHSLGGMAAPFIAARDGKLAGIIIMAGNARSVLDLVQDQSEYLARLDGDYSDQERSRIEQLRRALDAVRAGKPEAAGGPILGVPAAYWARLHKLDPAAAAAKLELPILILQAGRDYQVTRQDFRLWKQRLRGRGNVTFKLFDKLNHLFIPGSGPSGPADYEHPGHVDAEVIDCIADWIAAR